MNPIGSAIFGAFYMLMATFAFMSAEESRRCLPYGDEPLQRIIGGAMSALWPATVVISGSMAVIGGNPGRYACLGKFATAAR